MDPILVGKAVTTETSGNVFLLPKYGNRHGLVAGATGTGKTVTLMTLAEGFSRIGVPVFLADVKGDVAGLAVAGTASEKLQQRIELMGIGDYRNEAAPVVFWDLWGKLGHPVRTTVSEIGPTLLSRILELNETQAGVLDIVFKLADDRGLLLLDLEDLRALLGLIAEERKDISTSYGLVSTPSIGAIQRALLRLEQEGADMFFGEPALELSDLMRTTTDGRGVVNILAANQLILKPKLYSSFLLWLLSELFENLPEVGDLDKPKLVFVFDEAHLLFDDAPAALRQRIEQVVRLIRSKGVGVYFCSQFPDDVPDEILGQMGNRFQHALRAFTPRDQKAVKTAAELLGDDEAARPFTDGVYATVYLSPRDYHRVHMPWTGTLRETVHVPGRLFSVGTDAVASVPRLFARNERLVCHFDTEFGPMASVMVGALLVSGVETVWSGVEIPAYGDRITRKDYRGKGIELERFAEMARFNYGSTVIVLLPRGVAALDPALKAESPVRLGQRLASRL